MAAVDLSARIGKLTFRNPVTVASGTFGTRDEYAGLVDYNALGAVITKTITVRPRKGNPMPRICETAAGMLNAIGLQNKGLEDFVENKIPFFKDIQAPLIVNIAGEADEDFRELVTTLDRHRPVIRAIEINLSCPNVEAGGPSFMKKRERITGIVGLVRKLTDLPLIAKLSPELGDVVEIAGEVIGQGVDGLSLINTLKGMAIDIEGRRPRLANRTGGLSGPAIRPVAVRYVYEVRAKYDIPIVAMGGIMNASDALEFIMAGADMVALGTANFVNPGVTMEVIRGLEEFCSSRGIRSLAEIRGCVHGHGTGTKGVSEP